MKNSQIRIIVKKAYDFDNKNFPFHETREQLVKTYGERVRDIWRKVGDASDRLTKYKQSALYLLKIKKYANLSIGSDRNPYEVVKIISDKTVEVRAMDSKQIVFPRDFQVGGFSAHCADNYAQKYEYFSNESYPVIRIRLSKAKRQWQGSGGRFCMSDSPCKFYDYNF